MAVRQQRKRRDRGDPLAALLGGPSGAVLVARSVAEDPSCWRGVEAQIVEDEALAKTLRALDPCPAVLALRTLDDALLRVLGDRTPALVVLSGRPSAEHLDALAQIVHQQGAALLGPEAALQVGPAAHQDQPTPVACAATAEELERLCAALGPTRLALAPTPSWLPRWLGGPLLLAHDAVGYVPSEASSASWLDWLEALGSRELRQLLVPLGLTPFGFEPQHPGLEAALVAHALERLAGPTYPAPMVLALLREAWLAQLERSERPRKAPPAHEPSALWNQARRALPEYARGPGMDRPDPHLPQRVPTAAFLAQRGLRRLEISAGLLASDYEEPELPDPDRLDRADVVLEGAGEVLSDHESKVVLRGHGVEITRQAFANSASGAANFADKIGYPVVLKGLSPDLRRKRELGAIELGVANAAAAKRAYANIVANIEERAPTVHLDGVVIAEQVEPGLELRCGGLRMMSGGVCLFAQLLIEGQEFEAKLARSPLAASDALLLAEAALRDAPSGTRPRGLEPDVEVLAGLLLQLDGLFRHTGERLASVDLNPVRLLEGDRAYVTLEARITQRPHLEGL